MTTPVDPSSSNPSLSGSTPPDPTTASSYSTGGYQYQPMTFLGMSFDAEQTKQLWQSILKSVSDQIAKDNEKAKKTIRNYGKVPGDPGYED